MLLPMGLLTMQGSRQGPFPMAQTNNCSINENRDISLCYTAGQAQKITADLVAAGYSALIR